jgi:hypothetical protein
MPGFTSSGLMVVSTCEERGRYYSRTITVPGGCYRRNSEGGATKCYFFRTNAIYPNHGMPPYCKIKGCVPTEACKNRLVDK